MKNKTLVIAILGVSAFALYLLVAVQRPLARETRTMRVGEAAIKAEIADTPALRERGLSGRAALANDEGMLFIFDEPGKYFFWMNGMRFPLDFVYLNDNVVVDIKENVSQLNMAPFAPPLPFDALLEANAGFVERNEVRVGQLVSY